MTVRARHLAGLAPWASARPQYALNFRWMLLSFDALTDEAVAEVRSRIARDVRRERARRR